MIERYGNVVLVVVVVVVVAAGWQTSCPFTLSIWFDDGSHDSSGRVVCTNSVLKSRHWQSSVQPSRLQLQDNL